MRRDVILEDLTRKLDAEIIFADEGFEIVEDGIKQNNNHNHNNHNNNSQPTSTKVLIRKLALLQTEDFSDEKLKRKRDIMTHN